MKFVLISCVFVLLLVFILCGFWMRDTLISKFKVLQSTVVTTWIYFTMNVKSDKECERWKRKKIAHSRTKAMSTFLWSACQQRALIVAAAAWCFTSYNHIKRVSITSSAPFQLWLRFNPMQTVHKTRKEYSNIWTANHTQKKHKKENNLRRTSSKTMFV